MRNPGSICSLVVLSACSLSGGGEDPSTQSALTGAASISLKGSSARLTLTSDTAWTLEKTGSVDPTASRVTWTVTATKGATVPGRLVANGTMTVENKGTGGATIGNIVVNLQVRSGGTWVTRSSVVADATQDDAATTAKVMRAASSEGRSSFTENAASGQLVFMDASTNSLFSLVPQVTIPPGAVRTLLYTAVFDNTVLNLPTGAATRTEIIISFGNATQNGNSVANLDINGNGIIDPDEARVRSVPARLGVTVPASQPGNETVTLTDTLDDITTTGSVSFSNPQFNLGPSGGTVSVNYFGGTSGGSITNCAHLRGASASVTSGSFSFPSITGLDLEACDTQQIGAHACTPGAAGCGWKPGDMVTYNQASWGAQTSTAGGILGAQFDAVYPSGVVVGGAATMQFTSPSAVYTYLPANGPVAPLSGNLVDPGSSSSGEFGGHVLALRINVDFSDAGHIARASTALGNLRICGFTALPEINGGTVRDFLATANTILGGGAGAFGAEEASAVASLVNNAFAEGAPSVFAQDHLVFGACP